MYLCQRDLNIDQLFAITIVSIVAILKKKKKKSSNLLNLLLDFCLNPSKSKIILKMISRTN